MNQVRVAIGFSNRRQVAMFESGPPCRYPGAIMPVLNQGLTQTSGGASGDFSVPASTPPSGPGDVRSSSVSTPVIPDLRAYKYSVVIPVFNSETVLPELFARTAAVFESRGCDYEIVAVDDGSKDRSWAVLQDEAEKNPHITAITLVRNSGQHAALLCGLKHSTGDYVITIDDDLQNPPEEIFKLVERALSGYDFVCGRFMKKRHPFVRRIGSKAISTLNERVFGKPRDFSLTNFRLMSRKLVQRICSYKTAFPYINGLAVKYAGKMSDVLVEHHERQSGSSTYTPLRIARLVLTIMFNYSSFPLAFVCTIGMVVAMLSFGLGLFLIGKQLIFGSRVPGWTSLVVLISFFNGILTLLVGMLGEYVIRILNTLSDVQCYEVGEICKFE